MLFAVFGEFELERSVLFGLGDSIGAAVDDFEVPDSGSLGQELLPGGTGEGLHQHHLKALGLGDG